MKKEWTLLGALLILELVVCNHPPQTGSIEVKSNPTGADVALDDSLTGKKTNCVLEDVSFGRHKITLTLEGYDKWERYVEIDEDNPDEERNAGLTEAVPVLIVNSTPEGADIWLNDSLTGYKTNYIFTDLDPGSYTLKLTKESYADWETEVTLKKGDTTLVEADLDTSVNYPPEILSVTASPNPVEPGAQTTISCAANDADGDALTYEWESVDEDTTYTGQSFTWTAPETEGDYRFYVTVDDGKGGADYDSSLVVNVESGKIQPVTMLPPLHIGTSQATLIWTSAEPSWYKYELYRADRPDVPTFGQLIVTLGYDQGNTRFDTTWTDTALVPGTEYYYAVLVADSSGNTAWSNEISLTTESFEFLDSEPLGGGHGVRLANKDLYILCAAREQAVKIFTIESTGLGPTAQIPHPNDNVSAWAYDLVVSGNLLHVAFGKEGYCSYDIANPVNPIFSQQVSEATLGGEARAVYALGSSIFVGCTDPATSTHTLVYFDYANPGILFIDTIFDVPEDIYVDNNYIYVAEGHAGVHILSWNPILPDPVEHASLFSVYDAAHRVYLSGQFAYVASGTEGFVVVDVSNPTNPYQAAQWVGDHGSDAWGIYASGNLCYVADGSYGLRVLDLANPLYPYHKGTKDIYEFTGDYRLMDVVIRSQGMETQAILADWYNAVHMIEW